MASNIKPLLKIIESYERYLNRDLEKCKKQIEDIEQRLEDIRQFKESPNSGKIVTKSGKSWEELNALEGLFGQSSSSTNKTKVPKSSETEVFYLNNVNQFFIMTDENEDKYNLLLQLFRAQHIDNSIIYCNSNKTVEELTQFLTADGINAQNLVGKSAKLRKQTIEALNCGDLDIEALITVRRIDELKNVSLYINYELPTVESYSKKIGSSKKSCHKYFVVNIITTKELKKIHSFEKQYKTKIMTIPVIHNLEE